ncbi:hypothetical protein WMY93_005429 [Mugilogobius chulae]|uniref:Uncharacterized protein n=1 Tax=Mugilogobius chulae TaxID=88201 RepID=A0AAW0PSI9_9GOBI
MRLADSSTLCRGTLQIKSSDSWFYVCHSTFTSANAFVTCRDFGCGFPVSHYSDYYERESIKTVYRCSGLEEHLHDCPNTTLETSSRCRPTFLQCNEKPRSPEIAIYSAVSFKFYYSDDAAVYQDHPYVIKCSVDAPLKVRTFFLQMRDYNYKIDTELKQAADEDNAAYFLLTPAMSHWTQRTVQHQCQYNFDFDPDTFSSSESKVLDIAEASYVRLDGAESRCLGSLELEYKDEWRPVSHQQWSLKEAAVVCRQLGCGSAVHTHTQSSVEELQSVWRFFSDCEGSESALLTCGSVRESRSTSTVHVLCSDILLPVNVTVESVKNITRGDPIIVYSPYRFHINCSVPPQFPGGHFSLIFTSNDATRTWIQAAVNHTTVFSLDAEKTFSGDYSCIYHVNVSGHLFTQSKNISVKVEDAEDVALDGGLCSGTLLVKDGETQMMVAAEMVSWDMRHAAVVCRQLGCGEAVSTSKVKLPKVTPMWRYFSDCEGAESALLQCGMVLPWISSTAIRVDCADKM